MNTAAIIDSMSKLSTLHESLLALSKEKTDMLKNRDITGLQTALVKERKHIQAISQVEEKRTSLVSEWFRVSGHEDQDQNVSTMLALLTSHDEKARLQQEFDRLLQLVQELKGQEQLNADLTHQSLQYINLSLNMLNPSLQSLNYDGKEGQQPNQGSNHSAFDSKA
ncbi:hypothetical protein N781_01860 [Pontibacillus halophilus JSM 076056 = DSM 19796]|uniref:FlgN protein n=1 Tax=Pontibacillus halophilus JSM 076056 = DSM 19796 TaxID=1385510 RepID=A0A0A5GRS9_9BACI|nr:flagellar protein FlgN [Pontibacillus halophilus]KGX93948.1 hypothetical protein N781_01860 [Pontibacillus halophilus JSM 076056 = DSM 19796]